MTAATGASSSSSFYWARIKRHRGGATWGDGAPRMCVVCGHLEEVRRRSQAVVTAELRRRGARFVLPVGYCPAHIPEEVTA